MKSICKFLTALSLFGFTAHAAEIGTDFTGPRETDVSLTSHPHHIRFAWGHRVHTGIGKGGAGAIKNALEEGFAPTYGETGSPVVRDGLLLVSWSQPSGKVIADLDSFKNRYYGDKKRNREIGDAYFMIDADWHTLALDAETGEKLWERVEPSVSINMLSSKRGHNGFNGAAGNGIYVTLSILGDVFAYDLKSGETRWTAKMEAWNQRATAAKAEMMANRQMPGQSSGPFGTKRAGAVVVDDIVVIPDGQSGMIGLRAADGKRLWHVTDRLSDQSTPRAWTHDGKTWLVCNHSPDLYLLDPTTGETKWHFETGGNPGELLMGEDYLMLNPNKRLKDPAKLQAYRLTPAGPEFLWAFAGDERTMQLKADFGAHRKGVIRDGILYVKVGPRKRRHFLLSVNMKTGEEIDRGEAIFGLNDGEPYLSGDKLYIHQNSAHGGGKAGLHLFQIHEDGRFDALGDFLFKGLGVDLVTDYLHPIHTPIVNGLMYLRGRTQMAAIDLRTVKAPMAEVALEGAFAGFHRPVRAVWFGDETGEIQTGRLQAPPRRELGVVGTSQYRSDFWPPVRFPEGLTIGSAFERELELTMGTFAWTAAVRMDEAQNDIWTGVWSREFSGWEKIHLRDGTLHESSEGGFDQRGWPTGWLEHRPVTFFSDLPEGQERVFLQIHGILPRADGHKNLTLCLDHDGENVLAGVGGGFSFNQAYHEVDPSRLIVTENGIQGTALLIVNSDKYVPGNRENGGSLAGKLTLDLAFGAPDENGIYSVSGDWKAEWGIPHVRTGKIKARIQDGAERR